MSNDLYIKFLMRRLIACLEQGQQEKARNLIQKIMKELFKCFKPESTEWEIMTTPAGGDKAKHTSLRKINGRPTPALSRIVTCNPWANDDCE